MLSKYLLNIDLKNWKIKLRNSVRVKYKNHKEIEKVKEKWRDKEDSFRSSTYIKFKFLEETRARMNLERGVIRKAFAREHLTYLKKDNDTDIESAEFQGESMKRHVIEKFQNTQVKTNPLRI